MTVLPKQYLDTLSISEGQKIRTNCPVCGARNTFTVVKMDGVLIYNCFKLGCKQGMYAIGMTAAEIKEKMKHYIRPVHKEVERMEIPEYLVQPTDGHPIRMAENIEMFVKRCNQVTRDEFTTEFFTSATTFKL